MTSLSICTTVKNRSKVFVEGEDLHLLPNLIDSISKSLTLDIKAELVIADWQSTDWPIRDWIENAINYIPIHLVTIRREGFSAGYGRNVAASKATGDILFFVDADMIVNSDVIKHAISCVTDQTVYYPTVSYLREKDRAEIHTGGGNLFMTRRSFEQTNKWPVYWSHGFEDTDFNRELRQKFQIITEPNLHITHQWHPQSIEWKNRCIRSTDPVVSERREFYIQEEAEEVKKGLIMLDTTATTHQQIKPPRRAKGLQY